MNLPFASLVVIALLLPGVAFFYVSALRQRRNTELVRTNVFGDISIVFAVSVVIHTILIFLIRYFLRSFYYDIVSVTLYYDEREAFNTFLYIDYYAICVVSYVFISTVIGIAIGLLVSTRPFRVFYKNKWSSELYGSSRQLVSVYVMTNVIEKNKVLMYKGILQEYLMGSDGNFLYVVLKNTKRYFLDFDTEIGKMTDQLDLFDGKIAKGIQPLLNYLVIPGGSISNILFEKSPKLEVDPEAEKLLKEAERQQKDVLAGVDSVSPANTA